MTIGLKKLMLKKFLYPRFTWRYNETQSAGYWTENEMNEKNDKTPTPDFK